MENIEIVGSCFAKAGYESRLNDKKWKEKIMDCLQEAGVTDIENVPDDNVTIQFQMTCAQFQIKYYVKVLSGINQIRIIQDIAGGQGDKLKLTEWYLQKRNEKLRDELKYNLNSCCLEGQIIMRNDWKKKLIQKIGSMNRILLEDYAILKMLKDGEIPDEVRAGVLNEYREYEREMNYVGHI